MKVVFYAVLVLLNTTLARAATCTLNYGSEVIVAKDVGFSAPSEARFPESGYTVQFELASVRVGIDSYNEWVRVSREGAKLECVKDLIFTNNVYSGVQTTCKESGKEPVSVSCLF